MLRILGFEDTLSKMASFLALSLCDDRIVNPDVCDTIIQGVATFVCYPQTLMAIETISDAAKEQLMRCLMSAYDKRTWVHTTWILVRFWRVRKRIFCSICFAYFICLRAHLTKCVHLIG